MKIRKRRGSALAILLLVLAVLLVFLVAVVAVGARHSRLVQANLASVAAVQAAEAAIHNAIIRLSADPTWSAGYSNVAMNGELGQAYSLVATNNSAGGAPVTAPNGVTVPAGAIYLLSTGTAQGGLVSRQVAVFLSAGTTFPFAIASGGPVTLSAAGAIEGNIKSNGDLTVDARTQVIPVNGQGRVLSSGNITVKANLVMSDLTGVQKDVAARGTITGDAKISNASAIVPNDTSADTLPFVVDGSLAPNPAATGIVMPNPDPADLLAAGSYVEHAGVQNYRAGDTLDLNGQVHYFSDGLTLGGGSSLVGTGTIVVGNANECVFDIPVDHTLNIVVLDGHNGTVGGGAIRFNRSARVRGMVFCHGNIYSKANLDVEGRVIAYGTGVFVDAGASGSVRVNPAALSCPGFDAFFSAGAGPSGMGILSWQRL